MNNHRDPRADVLLLRDVPEQRLISMERLADELERGFSGDARVRMRSMTLHESARTAQIGLRRADSYVTPAPADTNRRSRSSTPLPPTSPRRIAATVCSPSGWACPASGGSDAI